jgi:hypothetical protein
MYVLSILICPYKRFIHFCIQIYFFKTTIIFCYLNIPLDRCEIFKSMNKLSVLFKK